ncbi:hypothetical protein BABINDRAFT_161470 [Babjeviella inositovora NRRL Y-12698]|uniref:AMP-dependent synthetase/ligase domain-containing protein n=1 Tax=Babjeviella inositovora NRRL Y-12698 TaxID=984486 RepID=A0A1E3QQ33_9ASCO|nr:uncharacterized protein BABINDRAFT_161470 [Babjeviella inositovora NRRL Y-12698]ODQ79770.1 hypothetical protein BABINDRAFT_161470 [Babjeviella inositovora NRRL Y-12698]
MSKSIFPASSDNIQQLIESLPFKPEEILRASPIAGSQETGYTATYRNKFCIDNGNQLFVNIHPSLRTLHDLFVNAVAMYPNNDCMGKRLFDNTLRDAHDTFYSWESFAQVDVRKRNLGSGIFHVVRNSPFRTAIHNVDDFVVSLYSGNRVEWLLADLACQSYSLTNTALYDTLGEGTSRYILELTKSPIVICSREKIQGLFNIQIEKPLPYLLAVVSMDPLSAQERAHYSQQACELGIELCELADVEAAGAQHPIAERPPTPDDLYTISFTSGTTGNPKGVEVHHEMGVSGVTMYLAQADVPKGLGHEMCFLPLAHIYERGVVSAYLSIGVGFGFPVASSPLTLVEELKALKPTTLEAVPRVFSKIESEIKEATINSENEVFRALARDIITRRLHNIKTQGVFANNSQYSETFTTQLKKQLGLDQTKFLCSASAPISNDTMNFFKSALNVGFAQAYGLTETFGIMCMSDPFERDAGSCGLPGISGEMRLRDVPQMGYTAGDRQGPRGELLLRGPQIFKRYYKNKDATDECFDKDGFFCTGDVARFDEHGRVYIIDRVKNFFKLAQGEYVTPEKIENKYLSHTTLVNQLYVHGDSLETYLVAVAGFDPHVMAKFLHRNFDVVLNPETHVVEIEAKLNELRVKTKVLEALNADVKLAGLAGFEKIHNIFFEREPLTVEREVYTPTFKLKRSACKTFFAEELKNMYGQGSLAKYSKL